MKNNASQMKTLTGRTTGNLVETNSTIAANDTMQSLDYQNNAEN